MNQVQIFLHNNKFQLGHIMSEASRIWNENVPGGAFTVGPCYVTVQIHGTYEQLLEENERLREENRHLNLKYEFTHDEKQTAMHEAVVEMFQIEKKQLLEDQEKHLQLMDELRLALQASVLERNQMREALESIKHRTAFHTTSPFKQINEVNEIAHKALGVRS